MRSNLFNIREVQINIRINYNLAPIGLEQLESQIMVNVSGM